MQLHTQRDGENYPGDIQVVLSIYKTDPASGQVSDITNGQIKSDSFGMRDDDVQCAYRTVDGLFYVYFTDVYTHDVHQGGLDSATATIYSFDGKTVNKLTSTPKLYIERNNALKNDNSGRFAR